MNALPEDTLETFMKNFLVQGLPEAATAEIAALAQNVAFEKGDALISKHDKSTDLFVILEGQVNIYNAVGDKLGEAGPGNVLGEVALVDDQPRSADAVALGFVRAAKLPGGELRKYMGAHRDVGFIMLANLCRVLTMRLRGVNVYIEDLTINSRDPWKFSS